ncbi:MAG TPA: tyrosine/phenylalanine carboxypeptidase domain-containing protein, partial [Polyangiaceae bacterium]
ACEAFAEQALAARYPEPERRHLSDDTADPASLARVLARRARELGLPLRVEVRASQLATAATGEGIVVVRPGVMLSAAAGERIAVHELLGHALPRARALHAPFRLFRAGTARSADHEEGRALLAERRAGLLDPERRRELALRHRAALAVRDGAEPHETVARLEALGASRDAARELARRAHRGGGLARELVYLPALFAVESALAEEPALERWLERGRLDLHAARLFASSSAQGLASSIKTGA